jgi:glucose/arabinose dehydrogenase
MADCQLLIRLCITYNKHVNFRARQSRQYVRYRRLIAGLIVFIIIEILVACFLVLRLLNTPATVTTLKSGLSATDEPTVRSKVLLGGRQHIWDMDFLPTGELLFTERKGTLGLYSNGRGGEIARIPDVNAQGEGGLLGLAIDPNYTENQYIYTCYNSTTGDIRVVRWVLSAGLNALLEHQNILTGIPANASGRHSGCQLAFGPDGYLWVGTGDAATGGVPQSSTSLGGKILRIDTTGNPAPGNFSAPFDKRIFSYGHRNTQGLVFFTHPRGGDVVGLSAEHGSDVDDELNPLRPGNFGWGPVAGGYDESVPMTDKTKFPSSVDAIWSSGSPTQAPSGVAVLDDAQWGKWKGAAAMAMLKDTHLKILVLDDSLRITDEVRVLDGTYGRLRAATLGLDGNLYVSSSNGSDDKIIRLSPQ